MEHRFLVYDEDGKLIRTFSDRPNAKAYCDKRPEFVLKSMPRIKPTETPFEIALRECGEALL